MREGISARSRSRSDRVRDPLPSSERLVAALLWIFPAVVVLSAWIQDDAFITLRTVDNWVHGYGLRWNPVERVQSFTHPLWMFLLSGLYSVTREAYFTTLALSLVCTVLAWRLALTRVAAHTWTAVLAGGLLLLSRAFVDYSTSGLENPLTHLLLVALTLHLLTSDGSPRAAARTALLAALAYLNRPDAVLFFVPALALHLLDARRLNSRRGRCVAVVGALVLGFVPLMAWEIFSLVYYGALVPNTAYAKLGAGIPQFGLLVQSAYYFLYTLTRDPATMVGLGLAFVVVLRRGRREARLLLAGSGLYLLYIVWIGGDYMGGRFLSAPLFAAMLALSRCEIERTPRRVLVVATATVALVLPSVFAPVIAQFRIPGVVDERTSFAPHTGLLGALRPGGWPDHFFRRKGELAQARGETPIIDAYVGFMGYWAGPGVHIVDLIGLPDPLLARLPGQVGGTFNRFGEKLAWKVGHVSRPLPAGYLETLRGGENRLEDPDLARLWDDLALVTRGPLWTAERWRAILRLHSGEASARAAAWAARHPEELARVPEDLRTMFTYDIREVLDANLR